MKRKLFLTTLLFLFSISLSWGAIPKTISYQGVLTDPNGVPVPDANYALLFKIYDSSTELWNETHPIVPVKDGVFNVLLGSITPLDGLTFDRPYDLGITVLPGSEMAPRIPLTASPYSLNPLHSLDAADGSPTDAVFVGNNGNVGIGTTSPDAPLHIVADSQSRRVGIIIQDTLPSYPKTWILGNDAEPNKFGLMDGSNYRWIVDANGNVGIGTTNPAAKLQVSGGDALFDGTVSINGTAIIYGTVHMRSDVGIAGDLLVTGSKSFVQDHPTDPTKEIVYVSLEGGEAGTYSRGTGKLVNGKAVIELPEHFNLVTNEDGLTVQLTPRGEWLQLYVVQLNTRQIVVEEAQGKSGQFDYLIQGVRKGYENHQVIRDKQIGRQTARITSD
ncbi:hypothetical protein HYR99_12765 [Candidatus Poribacteria bacterium]|nr:hypothetical protein [Candidatus Poribacteria bacterium]